MTKVVIFDLSGVLINVQWEDLDAILRRNRVQIDKNLFLKASQEIFQIGNYKNVNDGVETFLRKVGEENNERLRKYQIDFLNNWGKLAKPNSLGILFLKFAKKIGLKTAILSNIFPVKDAWMRQWGIDIVDKCFFSYKTKVAKPNQRAFLNVTRHFRVEPQECLMVGDSLSKDIEPAKIVGMKTLLWKEFVKS